MDGAHVNSIVVHSSGEGGGGTHVPDNVFLLCRFNRCCHPNDLYERYTRVRFEVVRSSVLSLSFTEESGYMTDGG